MLDRVRVNEGSSKTVSFTLKDQAGAAVPLTSIDTATLTLYNLEVARSGSPAYGIVNDRQGQDVKNTNNVTIHATSGLVTWAMQPEDNQRPDALSDAHDAYLDRRQLWRHRALFIFTLSNGSTLKEECEVDVVNLQTVLS